VRYDSLAGSFSLLVYSQHNVVVRTTKEFVRRKRDRARCFPSLILLLRERNRSADRYGALLLALTVNDPRRIDDPSESALHGGANHGEKTNDDP